jgi:hypothetical protein
MIRHAFLALLASCDAPEIGRPYRCEVHFSCAHEPRTDTERVVCGGSRVEVADRIAAELCDGPGPRFAWIVCDPPRAEVCFVP